MEISLIKKIVSKIQPRCFWKWFSRLSVIIKVKMRWTSFFLLSSLLDLHLSFQLYTSLKSSNKNTFKGKKNSLWIQYVWLVQPNTYYWGKKSTLQKNFLSSYITLTSQNMQVSTLSFRGVSTRLCRGYCLQDILLKNPFVHLLLVLIQRRSHFWGPTILFRPFYLPQRHFCTDEFPVLKSSIELMWLKTLILIYLSVWQFWLEHTLFFFFNSSVKKVYIYLMYSRR